MAGANDVLSHFLVTADADSAKSEIKGLGGMFGGLFGTIAAGAAAGGLAVAAISGVTGAIVSAGKAAIGFITSSIGMNAQLETTTLQFETLMGSADLAREHVAFLFEFAKKTPFETQPIIDASKQLQVFGGTTLNSQKNLLLMGDAAAAVQKPIQEIAMWSGRLYSSLQAGKPFGEAAMRLGELAVLAPKARMELEAMQKAGKSAPEIWAKYQEQLGKFTGAMEKQAGTWGGLTSTMKDSIAMLSAVAFAPFFDMAKSGLQTVVDFLGQKGVEGAVKGFGEGAKAALTIVSEALGPVLKGLLDAGKAWINMADSTSIAQTVATYIVKAIAEQTDALAYLVTGIKGVLTFYNFLRGAGQDLLIMFGQVAGGFVKTAATITEALAATSFGPLSAHYKKEGEQLRGMIGQIDADITNLRGQRDQDDREWANLGGTLEGVSTQLHRSADKMRANADALKITTPEIKSATAATTELGDESDKTGTKSAAALKKIAAAAKAQRDIWNDIGVAQMTADRERMDRRQKIDDDAAKAARAHANEVGLLVFKEAEDRQAALDKQQADLRAYYNWLGERRMEEDAAVMKHGKSFRQNLDLIVDGLSKLAQIAPGAFGSVIGGIAQMTGALKVGVDGFKSIQTGFTAAKSGGGVMGAIGGIASMATGIGAVISAATIAYGALKKMFGVSEEVKKARKEVEDFQAKLRETMTDQQKAEAGGQNWAASVIVVRDAFIKAGRSAQEAERLVKQLWDTDHPERARAAMAEINKVLEEQKRILERNTKAAGDLYNELMQAAGEAGGVPEEFRGLIDQFIQLGFLTDEQAAKLRGLGDSGKVDIKKMDEALALFKGRVETLGPAYAQAKIDETSKKYINALDVLKRGGADLGGFLFDAREELGALVEESLRSKLALPANLRPFIEELARTGNLLDASGNKIEDISGIKWGEAIKTDAELIRETFDKLLAKFDEFFAKIAGGTGAAQDNVGGVTSKVREQDQQIDDSIRVWQRWGDEALNQTNRVREAIDGVSFGDSPGGIKEWGPMIRSAIQDFHTFGSVATSEVANARREVDALSRHAMGLSIGSVSVGGEAHPATRGGGAELAQIRDLLPNMQTHATIIVNGTIVHEGQLRDLVQKHIAGMTLDVIEGGGEPQTRFDRLAKS